MSGVQSIQRAFALLRALSIGAAGITDLADRAELPKSTVARLLSALEEEGAVEQVEAGGEYRLGPGLIDLAGASAPGRNLIATARPHLLELMEQTGETSGIATFEGDAVLYLDHVESEEEVQVRSWTGDTAPVNLVPSGIALLAGQEESEIDRLLAMPLERATENSVTDAAVIRTRISEIRRIGYIWGYAEFDESINSVAAPVRDRNGQIIAAIHVHGPAYRFPEASQAADIGKLVRETCERISAHLR
jgi:DNA-binding IclR family transcriptional regulator